MTDRTPPWAWPEQTWRGLVERVRAGRRLERAWPGGAAVAVALSVDADHETPALRDNVSTPGVLAGGQFGARVGVPRLLDAFGRHGVPATFFVPAVSALLHPAQIDGFVAGGHEIALHGWIHERNTLLSRDQELDLTVRSIEVLQRLSGRTPVGIRTPSWDFSESTLSVIEELGLLYDSSLMADDTPYELVADGRPTGIVEIPVEWLRDDAPYLGMERFGSIRPHLAPHDLREIWRAEFDAARAEGGLFQLTVHPSIIGHRSRIRIIHELLEHIIASGTVWFATHEQVAAHVGAELRPEPQGGRP